MLLWLQLCDAEAALLVLEQCMYWTKHEMYYFRTVVSILDSISKMLSVRYQDI